MSQGATLKRSLGLSMATALVVGNMIGSGVFLLPASLASASGPIAIVAWLFTGAGAMLLALVFARLGRAYPETGGPYVYARRAFGDGAAGLDQPIGGGCKVDDQVAVAPCGTGLATDVPRKAGGAFRRGNIERRQRLRAGDAVGDQAVPHLESLDGSLER